MIIWQTFKNAFVMKKCIQMTHFLAKKNQSLSYIFSESCSFSHCDWIVLYAGGRSQSQIYIYVFLVVEIFSTL